MIRKTNKDIRSQKARKKSVPSAPGNLLVKIPACKSRPPIPPPQQTGRSKAPGEHAGFRKRGEEERAAWAALAGDGDFSGASGYLHCWVPVSEGKRLSQEGWEERQGLPGALQLVGRRGFLLGSAAGNEAFPGDNTSCSRRGLNQQQEASWQKRKERKKKKLKKMLLEMNRNVCNYN